MNTHQRFETITYNGKIFTIPILEKKGGHSFRPRARDNKIEIPRHSLVVQDLNKTFDLQRFKEPREPISLGVLPRTALRILETDNPAPRVLDLPIKFPGSDVRLPAELVRYEPIIRPALNFEAALNPDCYDEYYCYLTVHKGIVEPGTLQREAPAHVDGFQGARWKPKLRNNHTYTVSNVLATAYYPQVFDFDQLDDSKHDFFWEMNAVIADTNSEFAIQPADGEMTLMDCYCVHRGTEATEPVFRTFVRLSFEVRIFDRLGNTHNPMFKYTWPMVPRDIEDLHLVPFRPDCDPSLRVFPHQGLDGSPRAKGAAKTKPNLKPRG